MTNEVLSFTKGQLERLEMFLQYCARFYPSPSGRKKADELLGLVRSRLVQQELFKEAFTDQTGIGRK